MSSASALPDDFVIFGDAPVDTALLQPDCDALDLDIDFGRVLDSLQEPDCGPLVSDIELLDDIYTPPCEPDFLSDDVDIGPAPSSSSRYQR